MSPGMCAPPPGFPSCTPELQLLLCCGQAKDTPANEGQIDDLLGGGLDWNGLLGSASILGMLPLLAAKLAVDGRANIPADVRDLLRQSSLALHARNLRAVGELLSLLDLFAESKLAVMAFKGPVLAIQAYGRLNLRPFCDLDLLVQPKDVPAAGELLLSRNYTPRYNMSADQRANLLRFGCEHPFQRVQVLQASANGAGQDRPAILRKDDVDLHWNLFPPSFPIAFDREALWLRTEPATLFGRTITTIGSDVLVLYLCAHGYAHHWNRLEWICALARLIASRPQIDWTWIRQEAGRIGSERVLELGLVLAGDWMGAPVPAEMIAQARKRPAMATLLQHVACRIMRDPEASTASDPTLNEELFFDLDARETWHRRVGYFLRRLVTPSLEDVEWVSVPAQLPALYYALRPLRLSIRSISPQWSRRPHLWQFAV